MTKQLGELELNDFDSAAVWASDIAGCDDETVTARPELRAVPQNVHGLWVRFSGTLADGTPLAGISMAECPPPNLLLHSFLIEGEWHALYFPPAPEFVLAADGPDAFARELGRSISQVFPIRIHTDLPAETTGEQIRQTLAVTGPVV
jgi:hypothetical protein